MLAGSASDFAVVTPSHEPDFERCRLLSESLSRFARFDYHHYIIVSAPDTKRFEALAGLRTQIVCTDDLLPGTLHPPASPADTWCTPGGRPVKGWIVQQLAKIAFAEQARDGIVLYADSDVFLVEPVRRESFERAGRVRLLRVPNQYIEDFEPWYELADRLLGVSGYLRGTRQPNYVGPLVSWEASVASAMCRRIEDIAGKSWFECLVREVNFSEYTLYGVFSDKCTADSQAHFHDETSRCHCYWDYDAMNDEQLRAFLERREPEQFAVMLTARAQIDPARYRHLVSPCGEVS